MAVQINSKARLLVKISSLLLLLLIAGCTLLQNRDTAKNVDTSSISFDGTQPAQSDVTAELSQTNTGITVEVEYAKEISSGLEIGICYTTPDAGDWYPGPGPLQLGTKEVLPDEAGFTSEVKADGTTTGKRCGFIRYQIEDVSEMTVPFEFDLKDIHAIPREMPACQNLQQRLDTNPQAQSAGLKINCTEDVNGNPSVKLAGYNSAYSKEAAQKIVDDIVSGAVLGPWKFTIPDLQK